MISRLARELGIEGRLRLRIGSAEDYRALARFHYAQGPPASYALTVAVEYWPRDAKGKVVAVGVLSYPALRCAARERALRLDHVPREWRWQFVNRHVRTISRVVVHPEFRGVGLSTAVIRALIAQAPTRYVEAIARMGTVHPLFERAGMSRASEGYWLRDSWR